MSSELSSDVKFSVSENIANEFLNLSLVGGGAFTYIENAGKLGHHERHDKEGKNPTSHFSDTQSTV